VVVACGTARSSGKSFGESLKRARPTPLAGDRVTSLLPALAVALEIPMLQLNARPSWSLGDEEHFDLARPPGVGLDLTL
jgi:hypothetical protein